MIRILLLALVLFCSCNSSDDPMPDEEAKEDEVPVDDDPETPDQSMYFPPLAGDEWETVSPQSLGWNDHVIEQLNSFIAQSNTRGLVILKNGRIAFESYTGTNLQGTSSFTKESYWYWASAGKTLTAYMVGRAESQGYLSINDVTSNYLGDSWSSLSTEREQAITIWHQLTMTTGLDDGVIDRDCTNPECLIYLTDPETRWAYHNGPYTLLDPVVESATGMQWDTYFEKELKKKIGMEGFWQYNGYNHIYFSPARSMARFGLLILNEGNWDGQDVFENPTFFQKMISKSQDLNPSYGYLWWLNGQSGYLLPGSQVHFNGALTPDAPADMFAAMGKNGQLINVVPSQGLVVIRVGDSPDDSLVPAILQADLWQILSEIVK